MRVSAAVASCIGVGLVLQGCGGGGSTDKTSCLAEKMDVVSQTMSGKLEASTEITHGDITMSNTTEATFTVKVDFENFNMREDFTAETPDGETVTESVFIDVEHKQVVAYLDAGKTGGKQCVIQELPQGGKDMVAQLAITFENIVKPLISGEAKCGGNDGTYDSWKFSYDYSGDLPTGDLPPIPNLPSLDGLVINNGSVVEDLQMTKDALLHSSTTDLSGKLLNGTEPIGSLKMTTSMTIDKATKGGPSADDLDPSKFDVECKKVNTTDILPGFAHQRFLRLLEAAKISEHALVV